MFFIFSVHYQSITKYRFGRPATNGNLLYESCVRRMRKIRYRWLKYLNNEEDEDENNDDEEDNDVEDNDAEDENDDEDNDGEDDNL